MILRNAKNLITIFLSIVPGLFMNIIFIKLGHDARVSYSCSLSFRGSEQLGWFLSEIHYNNFISTYIIIYFFCLKFIFLIILRQ